MCGHAHYSLVSQYSAYSFFPEGDRVMTPEATVVWGVFTSPDVVAMASTLDVADVDATVDVVGITCEDYFSFEK